jgi:hypothetical protein
VATGEAGLVKLRGSVEGVLFDIFGRVLTRFVGPNLIVNAGLPEAARLIGGITADPFTFLAIGIGTTAAAASDTALQSEITTGGGERAAATVSLVTTDVTNDTLQLTKTFTFTGTFAVTEVGIFNDAAVGEMLGRRVFTAVNVVPTNTLAMTYKVDLDPS